jgi:hypothetical protein
MQRRVGGDALMEGLERGRALEIVFFLPAAAGGRDSREQAHRESNSDGPPEAYASCHGSTLLVLLLSSKHQPCLPEPREITAISVQGE